MTTFKHPRPGVGSVGQYQMSGQPYVSRSETALADIEEFVFPYVTKFVTVINTMTGANAPIHVGFSANGVDDANYFVLDNGEAYTGEWRLKSIFIANPTAVTSSYTVVAGLTGIQSMLSGTEGPNFSGSTGVG